jgi:hypothetical protein
MFFQDRCIDAKRYGRELTALVLPKGELFSVKAKKAYATVKDNM